MDLSEKEKARVEIPPKNGKSFNWWWIYIFILLSLVITSLLSKKVTTSEITWQQFENEVVGKKTVEKIIIVDGEKADVYISKQLGINEKNDFKSNKFNLILRKTC